MKLLEIELRLVLSLFCITYIFKHLNADLSMRLKELFAYIFFARFYYCTHMITGVYLVEERDEGRKNCTLVMVEGKGTYINANISCY